MTPDSVTLLVETRYSAAGVVVTDGVVTEAAPIYRWMVGKRWDLVVRWRRITRVREAARDNVLDAYPTAADFDTPPPKTIDAAHIDPDKAIEHIRVDTPLLCESCGLPLVGFNACSCVEG